LIRYFSTEEHRPTLKEDALMRKRIAAALASLALSLGVALGLASPAAAANENDYSVDVDWNNDHYKSCINTTYVNGCLQPHGDVFWIKDNVSNGHEVWIVWEDLDSGRYGYCINTLGAAKAWTACNKNFTEGNRIKWYLAWELDGGWNSSYARTTAV
jgi:hypothetical protein